MYLEAKSVLSSNQSTKLISANDTENSFLWFAELLWGGSTAQFLIAFVDLIRNALLLHQLQTNNTYPIWSINESMQLLWVTFPDTAMIHTQYHLAQCLKQSWYFSPKCCSECYVLCHAKLSVHASAWAALHAPGLKMSHVLKLCELSEKVQYGSAVPPHHEDECGEDGSFNEHLL